jgi:hypothetical protein
MRRRTVVAPDACEHAVSSVGGPSVGVLFDRDVLRMCVLGHKGFHLHRLFHHVAAGTGPDYMTKHSRRRKARTVFSDQQLHGLEKRFDVQKYLSTPERIELASQLSLSETQVRQNFAKLPSAENRREYSCRRNV